MVNIYLFIELLHTANAATTVDTLKGMQLQNCKFANVVVLSDEKLVAQLDRSAPSILRRTTKDRAIVADLLRKFLD